jgi:trehalose 6-phosphate synthase/phosphatase
MDSGGRLIVVSNRAPVRIVHKGEQTRVETTVGGVATAFVQLLEKYGGLWIAWSGGTEELNVPPAERRFSMHLKGLRESEITQYYWGMCNRGLWPLMHQMTQYCRFNAREWNTYRHVNESFAAGCAALATSADTVWIQDFHLALMPAYLRRHAPELPVGIFWHVPFPPPEVMMQFPWQAELLAGMLGADLIGFQTDTDTQAFLRCCQTLGSATVDYENATVAQGGRIVRAATFPIGAPVDYFERLAADPHAARRLRQIRRAVKVEKLIVGVDRLDYTKGLFERLTAFERFLERHPRYEGRVTMLQIAVPSRTRVPEYMMLRRQIEEKVARIVARFFRPGWLPVRYLYKQYPPETLAAYYLAADVAMVTPLRDGMNLVAKEYVATRTDCNGVLVLSNRAGAAQELIEALMVDPTDIDQMVAVLKQALELEPDERKSRMRALRARVKANTLEHWSDEFLAALQHSRHARTLAV